MLSCKIVSQDGRVLAATAIAPKRYEDLDVKDAYIRALKLRKDEVDRELAPLRNRKRK